MEGEEQHWAQVADLWSKLSLDQALKSPNLFRRDPLFTCVVSAMMMLALFGTGYGSSGAFVVPRIKSVWAWITEAKYSPSG